MAWLGGGRCVGARGGHVGRGGEGTEGVLPAGRAVHYRRALFIFFCRLFPAGWAFIGASGGVERGNAGGGERGEERGDTGGLVPPKDVLALVPFAFLGLSFIGILV